MKSAQIRSFFWSAFSCIQTEYGELLRKSPYSVRIQENTGQKNSVFGHFSRSVFVNINSTQASIIKYQFHPSILLIKRKLENQEFFPFHPMAKSKMEKEIQNIAPKKVTILPLKK